jgi:acyl-coenzyme A synthetase/AMP-(fatty) acid ligase
MRPRVPEWYTAMLGAMRLGLVPVPTPNLSTPRDLAYRLTASKAAALVTDDAGGEKIEQIEDELRLLRLRLRLGQGEPAPGWLDFHEELATAGDGDSPADPTVCHDPLLVFFTSGTVAFPKMVLHTQEYGLAHVATARF